MAGTVAIVQSSYIPWKGYFDLINKADDFVLFDDAQYTRGDWRSRNAIKTANGVQWLSIPVRVRNRSQKIAESEVADSKWRRKHWTALELAYSRTPFFNDYENLLKPLYLDETEILLSNINRRFIEAINGILGISTRLHWSRDFRLQEGRTERLVDICRQLGAATYLSGPTALEYLDEQQFRDAGIAVEWMDYSGYPEYPQLHPPFEHQVSILDMLFNTGAEATCYMKSFGDRHGQ